MNSETKIPSSICALYRYAIAICIFATSIQGCSYDVSRCTPFSNYAGHTVPLEREANIFHDKFSYDAEYTLADHRNEQGGETLVTVLPKGTPIKITSVKYIDVIDSQYFVAFGKVKQGPYQRKINFSYFWDYTSPSNRIELSSISRAPWEGSDIPKTRHMEWGWGFVVKQCPAAYWIPFYSLVPIPYRSKINNIPHSRLLPLP